jgi:hypothetical protein
MNDRSPECFPVVLPVIDPGAFSSRAANILGRSPYRQVDIEQRDPKSYHAFLAALHELSKPGVAIPQQAYNLELNHLFMTIGGTADTRDLVDIFQPFILTPFSVQDGDDRTFFLLSGSLTQWRDTLLYQLVTGGSNKYARWFHTNVYNILIRLQLDSVMFPRAL